MIRNFIGVFGLAIIAAFLLSSCSSGQHEDASLLSGHKGPASLEAYRLGPGDVIALEVFDEPNLSVLRELDGRGTTHLPLVSEVNLNGLTATQAATLIEDKYENGYLRDPKVTVNIQKYRPFFILFEIRKPGKYTF